MQLFRGCKLRRLENNEVYTIVNIRNKFYLIGEDGNRWSDLGLETFEEPKRGAKLYVTEQQIRKEFFNFGKFVIVSADYAAEPIKESSLPNIELEELEKVVALSSLKIKPNEQSYQTINRIAKDIKIYL